MSLFVNVALGLIVVSLLLFIGCISFLDALDAQYGGENERGSNKKISKILRRFFVRRLLDIVASLGISFFVVSHFYYTPIVCCMRRHERKVGGETEKRKIDDNTDYSVKYPQYKGVPEPKVYKT